MPTAGNQRLVFLDALRGIGAVGVTLYHMQRYTPFRAALDATLPDVLTQMFLYGWMGVPVFFVISGFVLAQSLETANTSLTGQLEFMLRRVVRLGVPYWVTISLVLVLDLVARIFWGDGTVTDPVSFPKLLANSLFLQDVLGFGNITTGTWFVCIILQLDLLFIVTLGLARRMATSISSTGRWSAVNVLTTACLVPLGVLSLLHFNLDSQFDRWVIYFICQPVLGMLAKWTMDRKLPPGVFWGYVMIMCGGLVLTWRLEIALAVAAGVGIYSLGKINQLQSMLGFRGLQFLGRESYSLFLIHYGVSWLVMNLGLRLTGQNTILAIVWFVLSFAASLTAAHLLYVFVEAPSSKLASRIGIGELGLGRRKATVVAGTTS